MSPASLGYMVNGKRLWSADLRAKYDQLHSLQNLASSAFRVLHLGHTTIEGPSSATLSRPAFDSLSSPVDEEFRLWEL